MTRERLAEELKWFKIPLNEYSFEYKSELPADCLYIEHKDDFWDVCDNNRNGNKIVGRFTYEYTANDFLFYLLMKKHVNVKKRWFWLYM